MPAVLDMFTFLEAQGIAGGSTLWDLLRRRSMDAPTTDQLVIVSEDGGAPPEIRDDDGIGDSAYQDVGVLITVRADPWDGDAGLTKSQEIFDALHSQREIVLGTTTYTRVRAQTAEPVFIGFDDKGRPRHTTSYMLLSPVPTP